MMDAGSPEKVKISDAVETLLHFSIDRQDLEVLLGSLPERGGLGRVAVEYELQLLKILSVGWSLSFFMEDSDLKQIITESFWRAVQDFSHNVSLASSASLEREFDYFSVLRERLNFYVKALGGHTDKTQDIAALIGPAFSEVCGQKDNAIAILCGTKMFHLAVGGVRHYLESVTLVP